MGEAWFACKEWLCATRTSLELFYAHVCIFSLRVFSLSLLLSLSFSLSLSVVRSVQNKALE